MQIIWTILIGFVVGLLARMLMPGNDSQGIIVTTTLGIVGAIVGAFLGQLLGFYQIGEPAGFFMSLAGALLILWIVKSFSSSKSESQS